jgi:metal-responsive CopG/Arc/MetJ family transcriptional regulator
MRVKGRRSERRTARAHEPYVRASISFPSNLYATLEELAKQKKVSLAWVVRDATEKYVAGQLREAGQ